MLGQGHVRIAGVDEAGRGAWAGPLTAAAVILPPIAYYDRRLFWGVTDSKKLTPLQRDRWAYQIHKTAMAVGVAHVTPQEIDRYGMAAAGRLAYGINPPGQARAQGRPSDRARDLALATAALPCLIDLAGSVSAWLYRSEGSAMVKKAATTQPVRNSIQEVTEGGIASSRIAMHRIASHRGSPFSH